MKTIGTIIAIIWVGLCFVAMQWQWKTGEWNPKEAIRHLITEIKSIFKN